VDGAFAGQRLESPLVISGLDNGTTYQVRIRAVNAVGVGAESDAASGIPVATPGVPSIDSVTAGDGQLSVAFTAGSDGGSAITNYEYSTDDGATWTARSPVSVSSPLVISGLVNGTTYQVRIRAVNAVGVGAESDAASGIPVATPGVPSIDSVTAGDGQLSVAFTAGSDGGSAITNYEYSTDDGATWTARSPVSVSSPLVISGLVNGTTYQVRIRAVNAVGVGAESDAASGIPVATPGVPSIDSVTAGDGQLSVAFTAGSDGGSAITNYEYSTDDGATWTARSPVSVSSPLVISGLDNGTTYQVRIRAVNAVGVGAESDAASGIPVAAPVDPPVQPAISVGCSPTPQVGATVTCTVANGPVGAEIVWQAAFNPVFASGVMTVDGSGVGSFSFTVPPEALGRPIGVELVGYIAPQVVGTTAPGTSGLIPTRIPAGEGPVPRVPGGVITIAAGLLLIAGETRRRLMQNV
jgi:hypothetical protein